MFMIIMAFYVEKHQNFAKQVVISSLLIFASLSFQLKVPKEGDEENQVVQWVDRLDFLRGFSYFEISYILRNIIYPSIFQSALHMSRMIDVNPNNTVRTRLQETQKKISRGLILSELITNAEDTKPTATEIMDDWNKTATPTPEIAPSPTDSQLAAEPLDEKKPRRRPVQKKPQSD